MKIENKFYFNYESGSEKQEFTKNKFALSCEHMNYYNSLSSRNVTLLVCFAANGLNDIASFYHEISNNKIRSFDYLYTATSGYIEDGVNNITFIKTAVNYNRSIALVFFHYENKIELII